VQLIKSLGVSVYTPQELLSLKDPQEVPAGFGLMEMNQESTFEATLLPFDADKVLEICYHIGNKLGVAMSYSGAGVMRTPQLCWITLVRNALM
jgi:hypothetical protein